MRTALLLITTLLLASACREREINISGANCPYSDLDLENTAIRFVTFYPNALPVLDRTDVMCVDEPHFFSYGQKVAGVTLWPGTNLTRARIKIAADLATYPTVEDGATAHEFMHLYLWDTTGDPCNHEVACGWDEEVVELVNYK